jgi:peptidoglycan-associated lipoprotein
MFRAFSARRASTSAVLTLLVFTFACRRAAAPATPPAPVEQSAVEAPTPAPANDAPPAPATNTSADDERRARARALLEQAVYFQFDRSELDAAAREALDAKVEILNAEASYQLRIEGHADERGSDEYNMALAMRRAASVQRYLAGRGIAASRLEVVSLGEERPVCREENEGCWQRNRRAEFVVQQ